METYHKHQLIFLTGMTGNSRMRRNPFARRHLNDI